MGRSAVGRVVGRFFDYGLFDFARFPSWYFMPAARTTRARSAQFRLRRELPCTRVVQFCLRRELPAPGTKGLFCICVESRNLT